MLCNNNGIGFAYFHVGRETFENNPVTDASVGLEAPEGSRLGTHTCRQ